MYDVCFILIKIHHFAYDRWLSSLYIHACRPQTYHQDWGRFQVQSQWCMTEAQHNFHVQEYHKLYECTLNTMCVEPCWPQHCRELHSHSNWISNPTTRIMNAKRTQYGDYVGDDIFVNMDAYIDRFNFCRSENIGHQENLQQVNWQYCSYDWSCHHIAPLG